jgi:hypothetical protein
MQVLGSLIQLPPNQALPLPWWHRAPLGLLDKTPVFLALVGSAKRPVGNLIVSVLNPADWDRMTILEGQEEDRPGLVAEAFDAAYPYNIAIAETVTTEAGDQHDISIVCEPYGVATRDKPEEDIADRLKAAKLQNLKSRRFLAALPPILWHDVFQVDHGWIRDTAWREQIAEKYPNTVGQVDLERAVVSADTERRLLRFLFPRRGAMTIRMEHADRPGALRAIAEVFKNCNLNVLATLLRRGGARPQNALLLAICEPYSDAPLGDLAAKVKHDLASLPHDLRARAQIVEAEKPLIYSHHPDELVARVPNLLRPLVVQYKRELPVGEMPIFISRRFLSSERKTKIVETVHNSLRDLKCFPVEAQPEPGELNTSIMQVSAKMWLARAGVVLVAGGADRAFGINLAHEAGFLQGQGKPVLILVEEGSEKDMDEWTNARGLVAPRFPADDGAFDPMRKDSIVAQLRRWIATFQTQSDRL